MTKTGKLKPNLDKETAQIANLRVLQRTDPSVEEILFTGSHVCFYDFDIDKLQWDRKGVEGSLFLVKRNTSPRFQFIVLNRLKEGKLVENLLGGFEYEIQLPYFLFRNASEEVMGMWFYESRECEEFGSFVLRIINAYSNVPSRMIDAYSNVASESIISPIKSDPKELETETPGVSVTGYPLNPSSNADMGPQKSLFENLSSVAAPCGVPNSSQAPRSSPPLPLLWCTANIGSLTPTTQVSCVLPSVPGCDTTYATNETQKSIDLVKPSSFFSSSWMVPPLSTCHSTSSTLLQPLDVTSGTPLLQPLPPPTPPPSLTSTSIRITRDIVRKALLQLALDDQFIDTIHRALVTAHRLQGNKDKS